ncbi:hypothetical protein ACFOZY_02765 [Chungangia koreensis]|uniref:Uncharacterized protein n=1 Tax=Chungangia koreensis TaxID=752657 RepID=A0ABV8X2L0_9LACT
MTLDYFPINWQYVGEVGDMVGLKIWKSKALKTILLSLFTLLFLVVAVLGITFWLLLYLDSKTSDQIEYDDISMQKEEGIQIPSSF